MSFLPFLNMPAGTTGTFPEGGRFEVLDRPRVEAPEGAPSYAWCPVLALSSTATMQSGTVAFFRAPLDAVVRLG